MAMMQKLPFLTSILVCGLPFAYSWLNQYDKEFSIVCPTGQAVSRIQSHHDNHYEDRQWNIECRPIGNFSDMCFWTDYLNSMHELLEYHCPNSHFVHGIQSYHSNTDEDRRFKFYCCETPECPHLENCYDTDYVNQYDSPMDYHIPAGHVMYGAVSVFDKFHNDRKWKMHVCPCGQSSDNILSIVG